MNRPKTEQTNHILGRYLAIGATLAIGYWTLAFAVRSVLGPELAETWTLLLAILAFAAPAWLVAQNTCHLIYLSTTDPLTGIANRRYVHSRTREEVARSIRHHTPLSLLIVDIDSLKQLNDSRGHHTGDLALRAVAEGVSQCTRESDVVGRFGGDEFVVLAPNMQRESASALATRIQRTIEELGRSDRLPPLSVSIGVADISHLDDGNPTSLLIAADRALYEAKHQGGGCSVAN